MGSPDAVALPTYLLIVCLVVLSVTAVALIATIVLARVARLRRDRHHRRLETPLRPLVLSLASGEADEGEVRRLLALRGTEREVIDESLVELLSKVRGEPAAQIAGVLEAHGHHERALHQLGALQPSVRARAAWTLGLMRRGDARDALVARLRDHSPAVALTAARSLGLLGDPAAAVPLLDALRGRTPAVPAWTVTEALTALGHGAAGTLGAALGDEDPNVRAAAAMTVALTPHFGLADPVRHQLPGEADPIVSVELIRALGVVGRATDVPVLLAFSQEEQVTVRRAAAGALGEIGVAAARSRLEVMLGDSDPQVAEDAAVALLAAGPRGREALQAAQAQGGAGARAADLVLRGRLPVLEVSA